LTEVGHVSCQAVPGEKIAMSAELQATVPSRYQCRVSVFVDIAPDESLAASPLPIASSGRWRGRVTRAALPVLSLLVFFAVWQLAAASGIWNQTFVPYPSAVWHAFLDISTAHDGARGYAGYLLWEHLYMTLRRVFAGVVIGVVAGVALGLVMGSIGWVRSVLEPWLTFLRALPPLAYFFLLVIWLGIDEAPKITLLALAALPPAAVATTSAVLAAPVGLQEAARALGASRREVIRDVVVPSALPETFTGIRLAVGMAYSSVVAAELFNGLPGIGGLVKDASNYNNTPVVLVGIFAIGISGLVIDGLLRAVERRSVPWIGKA
jgi:taurine transport system permease protein